MSNKLRCDGQCQWCFDKDCQEKSEELKPSPDKALVDALGKIADCPNVCNCCKDEADRALAKWKSSERKEE